jgi:hypothetical protein
MIPSVAASREIDLTPDNDNQMIRTNQLFLGGMGVVLIALGIFAGAYHLLLIQQGSEVASSTNNPLVDTVFLVFFAGMGALLLFVAYAYLRTRASALLIERDQIAFQYPNGTQRRFRWDDPELRLTFDDYIVPQGLAGGGERVVRLAPLGMDKTCLAPALLDELCLAAQKQGALVRRVAVGGTAARPRYRITFSRPLGAIRAISTSQGE